MRVVCVAALTAAFGSFCCSFRGLAQEAVIVREGSYWVETVKGESPGSGPIRLRVSAEGVVTLRGNDESSIRYAVKKRVRARNLQEARDRLRLFRVKSQREGSVVRLEFLAVGTQIASAEISITAPRAIRSSEIETKAGSISVMDMSGLVNVSTGAGRVDLDRIQGECIARTGGGDVQVGRISGPLRCYTGGGTIRIGATGGVTKIETAGGDIFLQDAGGPVSAVTAGGNIHVGRSASSVAARTNAGLIEVKDAGGPVVADTAGGVIEINSARGAQCASNAGAIRLKNVNGNVHASARSGSILAELLPGHPFEDSILSASLGDVTVLIPTGIAMTVFARNESAGSLGRIVSDFPEIRVRRADSGLPGPAEAEGKLNGGGPVLHVNVAAGNIYLRKQQ